MRKHFLLLFLMALLPLAGWATVDIKDATVAAGDVVYGSTTQSLTVNYNGPLTKDIHFTVDDKFYTKEDLSEWAQDELGAALTLAELPVGTYYLNIKGVPEEGFTGTRANAFKVTEAEVTVSFTTTYKGKLNKIYGQEDPAQPTIPTSNSALGDFTVAGLVTGDNVLEVLDFGANGAAHYQYTGTDAKAAGYDVTITNVALKGEQPNYKLKLADDIKFIINQVDFSETDAPEGMAWSFARTGVASKPYNGAGQNTEYTVTYNTTGATATSLASTDFKVEYTPISGDPNYEATKQYVGTYKIKITGIGTNFTGSKTFDAEGYQFAITKATGLVARVNVVSKTYDGAPFTDAQARYTFYGLKGEDEVTGTELTSVTTFAKNVGGYNVKANLSSAKIGTGVDAPSLADNYDLTAETVTPITVWTIIKRKANITVTTTPGQEYVAAINFDEELPNTVTGLTLDTETPEGTRGVIAADVTAVESGYTIGIVDNFVKAEGTFDYFTVTRNDTPVEVLANYEITPVAGKLQINPVTLTIQPYVTDITYGEAVNPQISVFYGVLPLELKEGAAPTYLYSTDNVNYNLAAENVKDANTYYVKVDWQSIKDYAPDGYEIVESSCVPAVFTINQKVIKPTAGNLTLRIGDNISLISRSVVTYADDNKKPVGEEVPTYTIGLTADNVDKDANDKITGWHSGVTPTENTVAGIITLAFTEDEVNKNYKLADDYVKGALTLLNTYELNLGTSTIAADIADAAANGNEYKVTLPSLTLKANEWYPIVLPFETSALELVKQLNQYVVLNTYNVADSKPGNIVFSLEMGTINAGVPFLIKAGADLNLTGKYFEGKDIVAAPVAQGTMETNGSVYTGVFSAGNVLLNGYELDGTTADATLAYQWLSHRTDTEGWGTVGNYWRAASADDHHKRILTPLEAYLQVPANNVSVRITVEDFDGQTTSIKTLSAGDLKVATSEGWYTINGIKLQSAPTEKGVYINNGKKVVIK